MFVWLYRNRVICKLALMNINTKRIGHNPSLVVDSLIITIYIIVSICQISAKIIQSSKKQLNIPSMRGMIMSIPVKALAASNPSINFTDLCIISTKISFCNQPLFIRFPSPRRWSSFHSSQSLAFFSFSSLSSSSSDDSLSGSVFTFGL